VAGVSIVRTMIKPPPGHIIIPLSGGCLLLLTQTEYLQGLRRGKQLRRREALARRTQPVRVTYAPTEQ